MSHHEDEDSTINAADHDLVLASLEPDQLAAVTRHHLPRRRLTRAQMLIFWSLRLYLLFMMAVVIYQVWTGQR
jgi:hypothetical protein